MKCLLLKFSLFIVLFSACSKDSCPDKDSLSQCDMEAFLGNWQEVGDPDRYYIDDCLSSINLPDNKEKDLVFTIDTSGKKIFVNTLSRLYLYNNAECQLSDKDGDFLLFLVGDSKYVIVTDDRLEKHKRFLFTTSKTIYRRRY